MTNRKKLKDIKYRDKVIRTYLKKRTWDEDIPHEDIPEFKLIRAVILSQKDPTLYNGLLSRYAYVYDYEYQVKFSYYKQKGDLLFTDGKGNYLIVECKSTKFKHGDKPQKARKNLKKQVPKLMGIIRHSEPEINSLIGISVTDTKDPFFILKFYIFEDANDIGIELINVETVIVPSEPPSYKWFVNL